MKGRLAHLTVWALLSLLPEVCHPQDFSADVIYEPAKVQDGSAHSRPPATSRLYVSSNKMRLESHGFNGTTMLVDLANHTATLLLPGQKAYEELGAGPEQYFRVGDVEDACPDWQKAVIVEVYRERRLQRPGLRVALVESTKSSSKMESLFGTNSVSWPPKTVHRHHLPNRSHVKSALYSTRLPLKGQVVGATVRQLALAGGLGRGRSPVQRFVEAPLGPAFSRTVHFRATLV